MNTTNKLLIFKSKKSIIKTPFGSLKIKSNEVERIKKGLYRVGIIYNNKKYSFKVYIKKDGFKIQPKPDKALKRFFIEF